jgi:peroxiredoxin
MTLREESTAYRNNAAQMLGDKMGILDRSFETLEASGIVGRSAKVGQQAPDFTLPDAYGKTVSLASLLAKGPLVLSFYRGEWCPFCNLELKAFQNVLPQIEALGATLVAVSPEKPEFSQLAVDKHKLTFTVLHDHANAVGRSFGLVHHENPGVKELSQNVFKSEREKRNSDGTWDLPLPGTFIIDTQRTIRYAHVDVNYMTGRANPEDVVEVLRQVVQPAAAATRG